MRIEDLKWWHWVVFSLLLGWLLAYVNSSPVQTVGYLEQQATQFERDVLTPPIGPQKTPWVRSVTVYPIVQGGKNINPVQVVMYEALAPKPNGKPDEYQYRRNYFCAPEPYVPSDPRFAREPMVTGGGLYPGFEKTFNVKPQDTLETITAAVYGQDTATGENAIAIANQEFRYSHSVKTLMGGAGRNRIQANQAIFIPWNPNEGKTVQNWLGDAQRDYSWVHYKFAWWKVPQYCNMLWIGSSFAIIGVFWPVTLSLLTTAGMGRPAAKDEYDISRFGGSRKTKAAMPKPRAEMSEEEYKKLTALNETLAASVKDGLDRAVGTAAPGAAAPAASQFPERKFTAAPAQAPAPVTEQPKEDKEFTGEFYPVARPPVHDPLHEPAPHSDKNPDKPPDPKRP